MSERLIVVSSDCHAGLPIQDYKPYIEEKYHEMMDMAVPIQVEMTKKAEDSFLIKEINDEWRQGIEQELTVGRLLQMPFYHPVIEEALQAALYDLYKNVEAKNPGPVTELKVLAS